MINLPLFTPITVHTGAGLTFTVLANWQIGVDPKNSNQFDAIVVYEPDSGLPTGLHLCIASIWRFAVPFDQVMLMLHYGGDIHVYYDNEVRVPFDSKGTVYRNGIASKDTGTTVGIKAVWGVVLPPDNSGGGGTLTQYANYSISLPGPLNLQNTVYYQEFVDSLLYENGYAKVKNPPTGGSCSFEILINGSSKGSIVFLDGSSTGTVPALGSITPNDIMEIVSPLDLFGASIFSIAFTFERV